MRVGDTPRTVKRAVPGICRQQQPSGTGRALGVAVAGAGGGGIAGLLGIAPGICIRANRDMGPTQRAWQAKNLSTASHVGRHSGAVPFRCCRPATTYLHGAGLTHTVRHTRGKGCRAIAPNRRLSALLLNCDCSAIRGTDPSRPVGLAWLACDGLTGFLSGPASFCLITTDLHPFHCWHR